MVNELFMKWLERRFPSSRSTAILFNLASPFELWNGEACTHITFLSVTEPDGDVFIRGVKAIFSQGERSEDLCAPQITVFLDDHGEVYHIIKSERIRNDEGTRVEYDNSYSDPSLTEPWKFEGAFSIFDSVFQRIQLERGVPVPQTHPLLNPYGISSIRLDPGNDGRGLF